MIAAPFFHQAGILRKDQCCELVLQLLLIWFQQRSLGSLWIQLE